MLRAGNCCAMPLAQQCLSNGTGMPIVWHYCAKRKAKRSGEPGYSKVTSRSVKAGKLSMLLYPMAIRVLS